MKKIMSATTLGITGLVTVGLLALPSTSASAQDYAKREDDTVDLVLMDDHDDDDTFDDDDDDTFSNTGNSASTNDGTRSNFTGVSRDRDLSRSDKTKDWTRDGGDRTRDHSANHTNDNSRNDTR